MREIKFRAWHNGKMMVVRSLHNTHSQVNIRAELCDPGGGFGTGKPAVTSEVIVDNLMQYTGLKDKNGVEIYEGDIVVEQYKVYNETDPWVKGSPTEVKWSTSYKPGFDLPTQVSENIEIIGNIYENPELLEAA